MLSLLAWTGADELSVTRSELRRRRREEGGERYLWARIEAAVEGKAGDTALSL